MTQELVVWTLLTSTVGLVWLLTCAILTKDSSARRPDDHDQLMPQSGTHELPPPSQKKAAA
jgi:hypothetical protein